MMQSLLRDIKDKVQKAEYSSAIELCESVVSKSEGQTFTIYSTLASCAVKLGDKKKAVVAFESAVAAHDATSSSNAIQLQKVWKTMADLYEELSMFDKQATALSRLYDIVYEKGNFERCQTLGELILDAYGHATSYEAGLQFATNHLKRLLPCNIEIMLLASTVSKFAHLHELEMNKKPPKFSGISASQKDQVKKPVFPECIINTALATLTQLSDINSPAVASYLKRYIQWQRSEVYSTQPITFTSYASLLCQILSAFGSILQHEPSLSVYLIEALFFARHVYHSEVAKSALIAVEQWDPSNPYLQLIPIHELVESCKITTVKPRLTEYLSLVLSDSMNTDNSVKVQSSTDDDSSAQPLVVVQLMLKAVVMVGYSFYGFQGISQLDMLHILHDTTSRLLKLESSMSIGSGLLTPLRLAKALALCKVAQLAAARQQLFDIVSSQSLSWYRHSLFEGDVVVEGAWDSDIIILQPLLVKWILLVCLRSAGLFSHVVHLASAWNAQQTAAPTSWLLSESYFADAQVLLTAQLLDNNSQAEAIPPVEKTLIRDVALSEQRAALIIRNLQSVLKSADELCPEIEALVRYRMGVVMWHAGGRLRSDKNGCIASLLASAKLDPSGIDGGVYTYIGHYYAQEVNDIERAAKCYMKALHSNHLDREAGISLCAIYAAHDRTSELEKLLDDVIASTDHAAWCYSLKGRLALSRQDFQVTIDNFQLALELDARDASAWHGLGVAYSSSEQNIASLKAFTKALEVFPRDLAILVAIADTERKLCLLHESKLRYREALTIDSFDLMALKGFATVCLALCYNHLTVGWTAGIAQEVRDGVAAVDKVIDKYIVNNNNNNDEGSLNEGLSKLEQCVYKLKGDLCLQAMHFGPFDLVSLESEYNISTSSSRLLQKSEMIGELYTVKLKYLSLAEESYKAVRASALRTGEQTAEMLFDIALAHYQHANTLMVSMGQGSGLVALKYLLKVPSVASLLSAAQLLFTEGLKLDPVHSGCWNGLGLCLVGDEQAVQRRCCFVRAMQIDNNGGAHANLGVDLMRCNEDVMAMECFSALQLIESNPIVWVNLGCIFEMKTPSSDSKNKTYDAFTAACEVAKPVEGLLGSAIAWLKQQGSLSATKSRIAANVYGENKWKTIRNEFELTALHHNVKLRLLAFVHRKPVQPLAWQLLAWVSEVSGEIKEALDYRMNALYYLDHIAKSYIDVSDQVAVARFQRLATELLLGCRRCYAKLSLTSNHASAVTVRRITLPSMLRLVPELDVSIEVPVSALVEMSVPFELPYVTRVRKVLMQVTIDISSRVWSQSLSSISSAIALIFHESGLPLHFDSFRCQQFVELLRLVVSAAETCDDDPSRHALLRLITDILVALGSEGTRENDQFPLFERWMEQSAQLCAWAFQVAKYANLLTNGAILSLLDKAVSWHPKCSYLLYIKLLGPSQDKMPLIERIAALLTEYRMTSKIDNEGIGLAKPTAIVSCHMDLPEGPLDICSKTAILKHQLGEQHDEMIEDSSKEKVEVNVSGLLRACHLNPSDLMLQQLLHRLTS